MCFNRCRNWTKEKYDVLNSQQQRPSFPISTYKKKETLLSFLSKRRLSKKFTHESRRMEEKYLMDPDSTIISASINRSVRIEQYAPTSMARAHTYIHAHTKRIRDARATRESVARRMKPTLFGVATPAGSPERSPRKRILYVGVTSGWINKKLRSIKNSCL